MLFQSSAHSAKKRQSLDDGLSTEISALVAEVRQDTGEMRGILSEVEAYLAEIMQKLNSQEEPSHTGKQYRVWRIFFICPHNQGCQIQLFITVSFKVSSIGWSRNTDMLADRCSQFDKLAN